MNDEATQLAMQAQSEPGGGRREDSAEPHRATMGRDAAQWEVQAEGQRVAGHGWIGSIG